eukprot:TRINITY_DN4303_c0_g1_i1.p1 TRINITY_DN4303_c0_g1~~TRINITY_DN4303_c0_g1_i1.p1  ORF type:complete len:576 (-),score=137.84 TRINITY_DN4303_c0_g1_i1:55-1782(-)
MGFISSIAMGFLSGLSLIAGLNFFQKKRSRERMQRALDIGALARANQDGLRLLIEKELYPTWVQFPEFERVNWLNKELKEIWPYVNKAASAVIKAAVEPILERYRPAMFQSLKFTKLTLGTIAPQLGGVKVVESNEGEVILEIELKWGGNPNVILAVQTYLGGSLPVQVKDVQLFGVFRVIFKPLIDEFPCFGALTVSLVTKPKIDFRLKVVGGEISSIPGLQSTIDGMIRTAISDALLWPSRIVIPIKPGDYKNLELQAVGQLDVKLVAAKGLLNTDMLGKSDPFAILYVRPIPSRMYKSPTVQNSLNPVWNEAASFVVEDWQTQKLVVMVMDEEGVQQAQLVGCADIPLKQLPPGHLQDVWLNLVKDLDNPKATTKIRGQVHLELLYREYGEDGKPIGGIRSHVGSSHSAPTELERELAASMRSTSVAGPSTRAEGQAVPTMQREREIQRGVLTVVIQRGEDLVAKDYGGYSDPYCVVSMKNGDVKKKTKVQERTLAPEWNQTFEFLVENGSHDMLMIEVWDHDTFGKNFMGKVALTLTRVLYKGEVEDVYDLVEAPKGRLYLKLVWKPQSLT